MKICPYCESKTNDFIQMNQTTEYSGIEVSINRQGMLRVRTYLDGQSKSYDSQDVVEIKYCPSCGKQLNK